MDQTAFVIRVVVLKVSKISVKISVKITNLGYQETVIE